MTEKILVVDDEIETLRLVGLTLQRQGFQIVTASNGAQGLAMAKSEKPDAIILDIMMPDMDGYAVTRKLRDDSDTSEIPILMFSARTQLDDKVTGYEAGVDDYVTKPIHPSELVAHVKSLLVRSKQRATSAQTRSYLIALLSAKGGVGVSTLALNLAFSMKKITQMDVTAVEMNPGRGSWFVGQDRMHAEGLNTLLRLRPEEITTSEIQEELFESNQGVKFLLTSNRIKDIELVRATNQLENILQQLPSVSQITVLDLGTITWTNYAKILGFCQEIIVVTESYLPVLKNTVSFIEELKNCEFCTKKPVKIAVVDKSQGENPVPLTVVQQVLKSSDIFLIPSVVIDDNRSEEDGQSTGFLYPESMPAQPVERLAEQIAGGISLVP